MRGTARSRYVNRDLCASLRHFATPHGDRVGARSDGFGRCISYSLDVHLELAAVVVTDYDEAIGFFVDVLGFELVEDSPP